MEQFVSNSLKATAGLAKRLAEKLKGGEVLLLNGELGAGKTAFTKYLAKALSVNKEVVSPTYTIIKKYEGKFVLYHLDMYRLKPEEYQMLGIEEFIGAKDVITVIEWNKMPIPKGIKVINITIETQGKIRIFNVEE